jgi:Domain of unknown function (DUF4331)
MSHHFDTPTAREDPRINLCDFYLFRRRSGTTVMVMTVNPDAGLSSPTIFREEGLYAFRFDLDNDGQEEVTFKVQFGPVAHAQGDDHLHVQKLEVRRATGAQARSGGDGNLIVSGLTESVLTTADGVSCFAGLAADLFAGDAAALGAFRKSLEEGNYNPAAFKNEKNYFAGRNVTAIVLEVPATLIGRGKVHGWATVSLIGHAPEVQVSRWGLPLITNVFMTDMDMREKYNRSTPSDDLMHFSAHIKDFVEHLTTLAGSSVEPAEYAQRLVARLFPTTLPYELDSAAAFEVVSFNGRELADDAMDVILSLATNSQLGDGVAPDINRMRDQFPYFGAPYSNAEQVGVAAHPTPSKK